MKSLLLFAFALRLAFVLGYEQVPLFQGDDAGYDQVGWNLAKGKGFVTQEVSPGGRVTDEPMIGSGPVYPAFLGLLYFLFGHTPLGIRVAQAAIGAVTVLVVFQISQKVFGGQIAFLSSLLTAVHPALVFYSGMLLSETLFAFFLALSVWAVVAAEKEPSPTRWLRSGFIFGLTILLREESAAVVFPWLGALWLLKRRLDMGKLLFVTIGLVLTVAGWSLRNYVVFKEPILVSTSGGKELWISSVGWSEFRDEEPYRSLALGLKEPERSHVLRREGIKNILKDPVNYLRLCFGRILPFWITSHTTYLTGFSESFKTYSVRRAAVRFFIKGLLLTFNTGLLAFALLGVWQVLSGGGERQDLSLVCLYPILAIAAVHFFLFATSRYQVPLLPLIMMFSAVGMERAALRFREGSTT